MRPAILLILIVLLVNAIVDAGTVSGAEPVKDKTPEEDNSANAIQLANEEAAKWEFHLEQDRERKLELRSKPVMRWSNPVEGTVFGDVYIWTKQGRPEVVVSIHNYFMPTDRHMTDEFHSLSVAKLTGTRSGRKTWYPGRPGVELKAVPGGAPPAKSSRQRLLQMRGLAREFSATSTDDQRGTWHLRLQSTPVYRYENTGPDLLDGAMFSFTQGTDPQVWLLIEARKTGDGHQWQYAFARFDAKVEFRGRHKDREVWSARRLAPPWKNVQDVREPYIALLVPYR